MICNPMYFVPSGVYIHLWLMAVFLVYIAPFGGVLVVFNHGRQNGHFFGASHDVVIRAWHQSLSGIGIHGDHILGKFDARGMSAVGVGAGFG